MSLTSMIYDDLNLVLNEVRRTLEHYGVGHWQPTLVIRNPDPAKPEQWITLGNDNLAEVAALVQRVDGKDPGTEKPRKRCRSCPHEPHFAPCRHRSGGTAYRCGCFAISLDTCSCCKGKFADCPCDSRWCSECQSCGVHSQCAEIHPPPKLPEII